MPDINHALDNWLNRDIGAGYWLTVDPYIDDQRIDRSVEPFAARERPEIPLPRPLCRLPYSRSCCCSV